MDHRIEAGKRAWSSRAQFGTHCVPNWEEQVKQSHVAQDLVANRTTDYALSSMGVIWAVVV